MKIKKMYFLIVLFLCGLSVGNVCASASASASAAAAAEEAVAPVAGYLEQQLIEAAIIGYKAKVEKLIVAGADVNATNQYKSTALTEAASYGHAAIVKLLLKRGADVNAANAAGHTALMKAAYYGHENIVKRLLQVDGIDVNAASPYGLTALIAAVYHGRENIVKMLLDAGADKNLKNDDDETAEKLARAGHRENLANMIRDYVRSGRTVKSAVTGPDKNYM